MRVNEQLRSENPRIMASPGDFEQALKKTYHGTLVSVHQIGILITGNPGIGKSRLAFDLLNSGHQFICDDATDIVVESTELIGKSPPLIAKQLWLNGFGLIKVDDYWGAEALLPEKKIDVILELISEPAVWVWDKKILLGITLSHLKISTQLTNCLLDEWKKHPINKAIIQPIAFPTAKAD